MTPLGIIFPSLLNFLFLSGLGRYLGRPGVIILTHLTFFVAAMNLGHTASALFSQDLVITVVLYSWISSGTLTIDMAFLFDGYTLVMISLILTVSFIVHVYSLDYMSADPHLQRFLAYLSLFTFFMLVLVSGNNLPLLFVGWEGVGICSYLLISFWFTRLSAAKAAVKAIIFNRIGDCGLYGAMGCIFFCCQALDFPTIFAILPYYQNHHLILFGYSFQFLDFINGLIFLGAMGKSAQFFLHVWLTDAMEGPTPVSALIHAATMVTAGVFLLVRIGSHLLACSSQVSNIIIFCGVLTIFISTLAACGQTDIKKLIAYSTASQLGFMVAICGCGVFNLAIYHLFNHGFFKALLFLSAGLSIHASLDDQEQETTSASIIEVYSDIAAFSSSSTIFFSGYYSKEMILDAQSLVSENSLFIYYLCELLALASVTYSSFLGVEENDSYEYINLSDEASPAIHILLGFLSILALFSGYLTQDFFLGAGSNSLLYAIACLAPNQQILNLVYAEALLPLKFLPLVGFCLLLVAAQATPSDSTHELDLFMEDTFDRYWHGGAWIDYIYAAIGRKFLNVCFDFMLVDKYLLELQGPHALYESVANLAQIQQKQVRFLYLEYFYFLVYALVFSLLIVLYVL